MECALSLVESRACRHCGLVRGMDRRGLCRTCYRKAEVRKLYPAAWERGPAVCQHCNRFKVGRPRGLCWRCYYLPGVKEQYAKLRQMASQFDTDNHRPRRPERPTDAAPGTVQKIAVMIARLKRGESLFHPHDRDNLEGVVPEWLSVEHHCRQVGPRPVARAKA